MNHGMRHWPWVAVLLGVVTAQSASAAAGRRQLELARKLRSEGQQLVRAGKNAQALTKYQKALTIHQKSWENAMRTARNR